jgi:hypothetical protein
VKWRNTLILLAVFVLLAAFAYFFQYKSSTPLIPPATTPTATPAYVFDFQASQITGLEIRDLRGGKFLKLTRIGDNWRMEAPQNDAADATRVNSVIEQTAQITASRVLTATSDLGAFGLITPTLEARVFANNQPYAFNVGDKTMDSSAYYVAYAGATDRVFLVPMYIVESLTDLLDNLPFQPTATPTDTPTPNVTDTPAPGAETPTPAPATPTP